jgi:quercetin dioxygenase-like cupin family protein
MPRSVIAGRADANRLLPIGAPKVATSDKPEIAGGEPGIHDHRLRLWTQKPDTSTPREDHMYKLMVPAAVVAASMATAAWSQTPPPAAQNNRYFTMPLEKDPTREVGLQSVTMPPGAGNQFHRHPGDQWTAIQEGEITFTVKGQPPHVLKTGESNYVPRGTVHRQQNLSDKPARYIEMRIFDKGKPAAEQVAD